MDKSSRTKDKPTTDAQLAQDYALLMQLAPASLPTPTYRENLEQPSPYLHVQTITTYGVYEEVA